jgi:hypothetical protein
MVAIKTAFAAICMMHLTSLNIKNFTAKIKKISNCDKMLNLNGIKF